MTESATTFRLDLETTISAHQARKSAMDDRYSNPKRWQPRKFQIDALPEEFEGGIHNVNVMLLFGLIMAYWSHIEDKMTQVLDWLMFLDESVLEAIQTKAGWVSPSQQIFRSVGTHNYRVKLLKNLLSRYKGNVSKDPLYDDVISEFASIGAFRNDCAHGLWWTGRTSGRVFLQQETLDFTGFNQKREVTLQEFESYKDRIEALIRNVNKINLIERAAGAVKKV